MGAYYTSVSFDTVDEAGLLLHGKACDDNEFWSPN